MALGIMGGRPKGEQYSIICRPPYFTALEIWISPLCFGSVEILQGDVISAPGLPDKVYAKSPCPLKRGFGPYVPYDPTLIVDATYGPARSFDQQGREILFDKGQVFVVHDDARLLLFDANLFSFEKREAPDWARDW